MTPNHHTHFMRHAILLSKQKMLENQGGPFGAVIVKDGEVIAEGWNQVTSHNDPTAHAEIVAIRNACRSLGQFHLTGSILYTSCEPCPMCLAAIYWAHVDKIFYANTREDAAHIGFDDQHIYHEVQLPIHARALPMEQLLPQEAILVFEAWEGKEDKVRY